MTYQDESFDLIITADIFEHIRNPYKAFAEIKRVLKPGGRHIFTIPVQFPIPKSSTFRVDTKTDINKFVLPARYHGNGIGGRSLVYTDFGEDMLEELNDLGPWEWSLDGGSADTVRNTESRQLMDTIMNLAEEHIRNIRFRMEQKKELQIPVWEGK